MLKKNWCLIILLIVIVVGSVLFYRLYKYYHYSPIEGHTETLDGTRSGDDYYACFKQADSRSHSKSDSRVVVLRVNATGITEKNVMLVNLNQMGNIDPNSPAFGTIIYDPNKPDSSEVAVTTSDLGGGKTKIKIVDKGHSFIHLGPGPYMVVTSTATTSATNKPSEGYPKLFYYYQTYDKDHGHGPDQCAAYRPELGGSKPSK
jgi:hypothetical protein